MRIAILSRAPRSYSTQSLIRAAEARGHQVDVIDPLKCYMSLDAKAPDIYYQGYKLPAYDALIPRIGASNTFYGCSVLRQFEAMRAYSINSAIAITRSRDKLRALQILARKGINMPVSVFAHAGQNVKDLIKLVGGVPLLIKLLEGTQGIGVVLAETKKAAESVIEAFYGLKVNFLIQEYISEAEGADIRCLVVGNKVVASMQRTAGAGEFRSNLHRGGRSAAIRITPQEREMAVFASKAMGLHLAGVDMIRSSRGPMVLEVNSSPGLEGIETTTKIDVAGKIIDYLAAHCKRPDKRYQG